MATPALAAFKKGIADPDFNAALPVVPKEKAKEDILAESGLNIARPKGISTIAGDGSTPFVPPKSTGSVPASQPQQDNAWTRAMAGSGQPSSPNAPVVNNPTMPQMLKSHGTAPLAMPPITAAAGAKPAGLSAADTLAATAGLTPSPIKQSIAGPLVMLDGKKGLGDTSAISRRVDWSPGSANVRAGIADVKYNEEVAKATQANAAQSDMLANRGIAQRFNDLSSNNTTWSLPKEQKLSIANMEFNAGQKNIADDKELTGKKYTADQSLAGTVYAADQSAQTHKYNADQSLAGNKYVADQNLAGVKDRNTEHANAIKRQAEIETIKDETVRKKEQEKLDLDLAKSWVKGQTGMEHPDDIRAGLSYLRAVDNYKRSFDKFIDSTYPENVRAVKATDPAVIAMFNKRFGVEPAPPVFPQRQLAGVM